MNQSQSQLYNLSKSNLDDLYLENESNKTKSLIKDHENEIAGFPNDTEEIKKEPVELNNQENQEDAFLENFQKTTTEFDNSYAIKLPKGMNNTGYKIDYSKIDVYKFLEALLELIKIHKEMNKNNNTKKIKFNSLKELHQYIDKNFVLNDKYKNNKEQIGKDIENFMKSVDLFSTVEMNIRYLYNYAKMNNLGMDETKEESLENSIEKNSDLEEEDNSPFGNYNGDTFFA